MKSNSFEWYYFDIHSHNGYDVVFTLHVKPFMSSFEVSIFDFFIYRKNKLILHHFFSRKQEELQENSDGCILKFDADNYLKKEGSAFHIHIREKELDFNLLLNSILPNYKPIHVNILPEALEKEQFNWIVYAPLCNASGTMRYRNQTFSLEGKGYHDYNGGTINLKKELKGWYWGKFFEEDRLTILGQIIARNGNVKNVALTMDETHIELKEDIPINRSEDAIRAGAFRFIPQKQWLLDDVHFLFLSAATPTALFINKIIEFSLYMVSRIPGIRLFHTWASNTRYRRFRAEGNGSSRSPVVSFSEEIVF